MNYITLTSFRVLIILSYYVYVEKFLAAEKFQHKKQKKVC